MDQKGYFNVNVEDAKYLRQFMCRSSTSEILESNDEAVVKLKKTK